MLNEDLYRALLYVKEQIGANIPVLPSKPLEKFQVAFYKVLIDICASELLNWMLSFFVKAGNNILIAGF